MKIGEKITITRKDNNASSGYHTVLAKLEGFVLYDLSYTPAHSGLHGAPGTKRFTFQAVKEGKAEVQFAAYRPWELQTIIYEDVLTFDVEKGGQPHLYLTELGGFHLGGWSKFAAPGGEALAAFKEAVGSDIDVFTPLLVTSQIVNGRNYIFLANVKIIAANNVRPVLVRIQKTPGGAAVRTGLETPDFPVPGSTWSSAYRPAGSVSAGQKELLEKALTGWIGSSFEALLASDRPLGGGALFAGNLTISSEGADVYPALLAVEISAGHPSIASIEKVFELV
ncbi:MAG: protease inhibitor I42 family protein [Spirochaetaceae bacterium]|jgi:predicted secreted protein|nr:protease inhibitor I42 family protein [Spirochaetaceae bacterium]